MEPIEQDLSLPNPFGRLNDENVAKLLEPISIEEIEYALKIANPNKAPGLDGFNAHFFKICWSIIGREVGSAIMEFFRRGPLLNQLKGDNVFSRGKFRPISLTNELYKIISRILVNRKKPIIGTLISPMQYAFIPGRSIAYNILLAHDILHNFT